jgi:E3 ubiquitin-protein ligase HUWE1
LTDSYPIPERPEGGVEDLRLQLKRNRINRYEAQRKDRSEPALPGFLSISVAREHIAQQSLQCVGSTRYFDLLAKSISVKFAGEQGIDAGGVARDWFDSLGRSLASAAENGDGHLMVLPDNTLFPRPYENRFTELYAIGRLFGLAVWFGISVPISLGSVACKFLMDLPISPADLRRLDPDFYKFRVEPILRSGGVAELEEALCEPLMFVSAPTDLRESKELCEGGEAKRVNEENKLEYVRLLCEYHLCGDMQEQINVFLQGFWDIFPKELLKESGLSYRELALLIAGYSDLDPHDWQMHTDVSCREEHHSLVSWFWEMVGEMSQEERAKLLHFTTGSSRLPSTGFAGMSPLFNISIHNQDVQHLPQSHTCGNQLVLPPYRSKQILVTQMQTALQHDEGFGFF